MVKKYYITIEETVSDTFEITAENEEQARSIAIEKYKSGELVLEPGNLIHKRLTVNNNLNQKQEWTEF